MRLKEKATDFLNLVVSNRVDEAFQKYVSNEMIHHNPYFKGDAGSLRTAMKKNAAEQPGKIFEVQIALDEGDLAVIFSRFRIHPDEAGIAVVHIFRFEGGLIVEMWDVGQTVPEDSPNENGMF